ncbi:SusE domain-containing protein [Fulvivirga ligni]|uniref:SusE domain-containing protein n=1 Tax=Fulvivirga ligni TaxID=2904246 RepID=UPI001F42A60A|nr:SusE domain-containing protein [Fulvivirga ligni]UII19347.1 SusE domain-containing protein [Fulvivirga ligni]
MKVKNIYALIMLAAMAFSCEKDEEQVVMTDGTAPELSASGQSFVLTEETGADEALTLSWTAASFGFDGAEAYEVQVSSSQDFEEVTLATVEGDLSETFTINELNAFALRFELPAGNMGKLYLRVEAALSSAIKVYSNSVEIEVTPYQSESPYPVIYMVGDAVENAWDATMATAMFRDSDDSFTYTFTGNFNEGSLKFIGTLGAWAPQWGWASETTLAFRETDADADPGTLWVPAGYNTVTMNVQKNTYSIVSYDASSATNYASNGLSGDFNGWGETAMSSSALNPHIWTLDYTFDDFTKVKFRPNGEWWGTDGAPEAMYEHASGSGADIYVEAGTYTIRFNDLTGRYIFIKK